MPWDPTPTQGQAVQDLTDGSKLDAGNVTNPIYAPNNGQRIKNENETENNYSSSATYIPTPMNPEAAQQRAASLLQQQYGSQASASLDAMQQRGIALPGHQARPTSALPQVAMPANGQSMDGQNGPEQTRIKTETDGTSDEMSSLKDWNSLKASVQALTVEQKAMYDQAAFRNIIESSLRGLESGLMQPLSIKAKPRRETVQRSAMTSDMPLQLDGEISDGDVKDEGDEDAINSDLDSSGDEAGNAEDDDEEIDSMLCLYDKVQRVKNKWKCTLKDGVLYANGKE